MTKRWLVPFLLVSGLILTPAASRTAEPRKTPGTLTGTVTDSDGRAVAGIPLRAISSPEQIQRDLQRVIRLEPEPSFPMMTGRLLGLAPGQTAEIVGVLDTPDITVYARAWLEGDRYTFPIRPGSWSVQGFLYDAAGNFLRRVHWTLDIPAGHTEPELELDLDLANAEALPEEP